MSDSRTVQLKRVTEIYNRLAPNWDRRQGLVERRLMGVAMRQALGRKLRGDVLEVGSGTGATLPYVTFGEGVVTSFTGTDISDGMLAEARKLAGDRHDVTFILMQADALTFPDANFDVVTTSLVLCTVPDPERALREMSRVCKPDGLIVVLEHVRAQNPLLAWLQKKLTPFQVRAMGCHFDRPTDQTMREMGFEIESEVRRFFGIFVLITARPIAVAASAA